MKTEKEESELGCAAGIIAFTMIVPGMIIGGWCISLMWGWFVCPLGIRAITIPHAIGLEGLAAFPLMWVSSKIMQLAKKEKLSFSSVLSTWLAMQAGKMLILGTCWIVHHFFM